MKVLFIEDHEGFAFIVREMLCSIQGEPIAFEWASRLDQGIDFISRSVPDVVIVDLALPDSDGLNALKQLLPHAGAAPQNESGRQETAEQDCRDRNLYRRTAVVAVPSGAIAARFPRQHSRGSAHARGFYGNVCAAA